MNLIRATESDVAVLLAIEETAKDLIVYDWGFTDLEFLEWINTDIVYLIKEDGVMVGDISYVVKDADHAYITGLVIVPQFQRRGLARKAMNMLLDELKGFRHLALDVHPDNHAVKLYESLGFVATERKENFYGDGEPRIIMTRER
ncbi:MAG: GNAT family N-acetyltransferase [Candidatus Moranbacteria bacterium]|nr:GNAT family N-acetyltransferase [Candidatus Moranbacteria bacterium]